MPCTSQKSAPDRSSIRRWAKLRLWAGYIYLALALVFAHPAPVGAGVGVVLTIVGISLRVIASATLIKDKQLCVSGIYAATRNPLYLGSATIGLGYAALSGSPWILAVFLLVLVPLYHRMIVLEEEYLTALYPEAFSEYCKSAPRFLPRLSALVEIRETLNAERLRRSKELHSAALILALAAILLAWHRTWLPG